jgi:hypothetical protein
MDRMKAATNCLERMEAVPGTEEASSPEPGGEIRGKYIMIRGGVSDGEVTRVNRFPASGF